MSGNEEVSIRSVFGIKSIPSLKIEFDQDNPGAAILVSGNMVLATMRDVKTIMETFEDKFPFALEDKKED